MRKCGALNANKNIAMLQEYVNDMPLEAGRWVQVSGHGQLHGHGQDCCAGSSRAPDGNDQLWGIGQGVVGYELTVCSGVVTFEHGEHTGALPGKLAKNPRATGRVGCGF